MKKHYCLTLILSAVGFLGSAQADTINPVTVSIVKFQEVVPGIYRGGRPDNQDLTTLVSEGLKTDIDLENDPTASGAELSLANTLGLDFVAKPMSGFWIPNDSEVNAVQAALNNPSLFPIFLHCEHGEDRTGLMVGLYRVFTQHWTVDAAYQEMLANGFHPLLLGLHHYWNEKTDSLR